MLDSNTKIIVDGECMRIQDFVKDFVSKSDSLIESYDTKKNKQAKCHVNATRSSDTHHFIFIETETGDNVILTGDQKIYDPVKQQWTRADKITTTGAHVVQYEIDKHIKVVNVHKIKNNTIKDVYTLIVDDTQCFFANNILVHNAT